MAGDWRGGGSGGLPASRQAGGGTPGSAHNHGAQPVARCSWLAGHWVHQHTRSTSPSRVASHGFGRPPTLNPRTSWEALVVWFLASFDLGSDLSLGYSRPDENGKPTVTSITVVAKATVTSASVPLTTWTVR